MLFKSRIWIWCLLSVNIVLGQSDLLVSIPTTNRVILARNEIELENQQNKKLRSVVFACGAGITAAIIWRWLAGSAPSGQGQSNLTSQEVERLVEAINFVRQNPELQNSLLRTKPDGWMTWSKQQLSNLSSATLAMLIIPEMAKMVGGQLAFKTHEVFGKRNLMWLIQYRLKLPDNLQRLRMTQIQFDAQAFSQTWQVGRSANIDEYLNLKLQDRANNYSAEDQQFQRLKLLPVLIAELNVLMSNICFLAAYLKYFNLNSAHVTMLAKLADDLLAAAYELACAINFELTEVNATSAKNIFAAINRFCSSYSVIIEHGLLFSK